MKILLDPQIFIYQKYGGISRYFTEIYIAFKKKKNVEIACPIVYTENLHLKEYGLFQSNWQLIAEVSSKFSYSIGKKLKDTFKVRSLTKTQGILQQQKSDIFVPTYYDPYFLKNIGNTPFVLTVYDMINEIFPDSFKNDTSTVPNKKLLMEKATKIIAISESTKRDILRFYPHIDASKIEIVYLGYTINADSTVALQLPSRYILFVGNRQEYKNFIFFLQSVAPLLKSDPNLFLVCAGGNSFTAVELNLITELGLKEQIIQRNFNDNELATYYTNAKCFVFPSQYEGFGIPVLESMACGCPVVLANHSSFPEVAGDAGVYFELNDGADLCSKIQHLVSDEEFRTQYSLKGKEQSKKFSWEICAENIYSVFQSVVK
jgi:glycosyltransferase involved in cell wall biosynthesis